MAGPAPSPKPEVRAGAEGERPRPARAEAARRREPVSRSAQATAAVLALVLLVAGLLGRLALDGGPQPLLGGAAGMIVAGIGLDVYARGLGAWAARDRPPLAVLIAVVGSAAVLWHAVTRRAGRLAPEPGAVAALLVPVALVVFFWAQASA